MNDDNFFEDISLESISEIAYENYNDNLAYEDYEILNALGWESISSEDIDDPSYYAMEALHYAHESDLYDNAVNNAFKIFDTNKEIVTKIKTKYGIEELNPEEYGLESQFGDVMKQIGEAIIAAFKRVLQAVMNFIRTIINLVKSAFIKSQQKYYAENKTKIIEAFGKGSDKTINTSFSNKTSGLLEEMVVDMTSMASLMSDINMDVTTAGIEREIARLMLEDKNAKDADSKERKAFFATISKFLKIVQEKFKKAANAFLGAKNVEFAEDASALDTLDTINASIRSTQQEMRKIKLKKTILEAIDESEKSSSKKITDVFTVKDFEFLVPGHENKFKNMTKTCKMLSKSITMDIKSAQRALKLMIKSADGASKETTKTAVKQINRLFGSLASLSRTSKNLSVSGCILIYGRYLSYRSTLVKAAKILIGSKKEEKKK